MKALRILAGADVTPRMNSGVAGTVFQTNRALRELGHKVDEFWEQDLPHRIHHGNLHYLLELPRGYRRTVRGRCAQKEYDVVQLSQPHAWLAAQDHQRQRRHGVFINRSHGVEPRVDEAVSEWRDRLKIPEQGFPRSLASAILRKLIASHWPAVAKASDGIIVPCEDDREYLVSLLGIDSRKVCTIHHGVPQRFLDLEPVPVSSDRIHRLLHVAQFSFFKGPHILAQVVNKILTTHPEVTFTWASPVSQHENARSLFDFSVLDHVHMINWMPQEDLLSVYDHHGVFLFTSLAEGAAKATLEAMSRGLCVVASNNSGMKDYIVHGQNGILIPVGDVNAFAEAIVKLLMNPELCRRISAEARSSVSQYTWRRCAEKTVDFYQQLLSRERSFTRQ